MDYKAKAKEMAAERLKKMGGKRSERVENLARANGGRICKADGGMLGEPDGDEFDSGAEMDGDSSKPRLDKPSRGGKTTINIMVSGKPDAPAPGAPPPMPMPAGPPPPPPMAGPPGPPPGLPPMPMRANGGRIKKEEGGGVEKPDGKKVLGGAGAAATGVGAAKYLHEITKPGGGSLRGKLVGAGLGALGLGLGAKSMEGKEKAEARAHGGRMTAGAATGEGRLEKAEMARKHK